MKIIFATGNPGKLTEMKHLVEGMDVEVISSEEAQIKGEAIEDADNFAENALKKARYVRDQVPGAWVVADDSGVEIDALDGQPGVNTARWAGEDISGSGLVDYTLEKMKDVPEGERQASFVCALALIDPSGKENVFTGRCPGKIPLTPSGEAHPRIPYDVIFIPEGFDQTFGEMEAEQKHKLSHRGRAFVEFKKYLEEK